MRVATLFTAATVSYVAACSVGVGVATRAIDTSNARWVHHALYVSTCVTSAAAVGAGVWGRPRRTARSAALLLAPAAVPLALIPYVGTHTRRHPAVALTAAPFLLAALIRSWR